MFKVNTRIKSVVTANPNLLQTAMAAQHHRHVFCHTEIVICHVIRWSMELVVMLEWKVLSILMHLMALLPVVTHANIFKMKQIEKQPFYDNSSEIGDQNSARQMKKVSSVDFYGP